MSTLIMTEYAQVIYTHNGKITLALFPKVNVIKNNETEMLSPEVV